MQRFDIIHFKINNRFFFELLPAAFVLARIQDRMVCVDKE